MTELAYWLALARVPGIGPQRFQLLREHFPNPAEIFTTPLAELKSLRLPKQALDAIAQPDWRTIERELAWAEQPDQHILTPASPNYPQLLASISDAPPILYSKGNIALLNTPQLAIIGSRNPTKTGAETAYQFAHCLAEQGLTITSGLALGIDGASHRGALAASGATIAVTGTGLNRVYPAQHHELARQIAEQGLLVSEFAPDTPAKTQHFPRRNRIISGLSHGVIVVEAAIKSGSLITARSALEQGREVFAIPGSIHNPLSRGCHQLIRQGAKLVECAEDILEELQNIPINHGVTNEQTSKPSSQPKLEPDEVKILAAVGYESTSADVIIDRSGLSPAEVMPGLLTLELKGHILSSRGGYTRKH
ncbi:MAG: DNA-protecting protein DprA [Legionellales bacterium]|nr:DNA-protecting protein DprA [Legionellales bacterium]